MRRRGVLLAVGAMLLAAPAWGAGGELARWKAEAARVTITRDDWGIAHVHGKSDADAVFGMAYAQAEDDFNRVETNYLTSLGRTAEAEGEGAIWADLRQKLYADPAALKADYAKSPAWLKALMDGWADGLNYFLATHSAVKPRVIRRFEPWMALSFTEGSIGGDIERISLSDLEAFYGKRAARDLRPLIPANAGTQMAGSGLSFELAGTSSTPAPIDLGPGVRRDERDSGLKEPSGSNGIAIAPKITRDGHALLLINPHTSFFFRSELQMTSDAGLNAYGAVTWGQFFIYQGFNPHAGWMHTSSGVDSVDEFSETIVKTPNGALAYRYGAGERPVRIRAIAVPYRKPDGSMGTRSFTAYFTHHGPIVRAEGDRWIAFAMMFKPVEALEQSFLRTKQTDLAGFLKVAEDAKANSSNNTLFADDKGEIAYLHAQFIPKRDDRFDYTKVVDGADPATDWGPLHALDERPNMINPPTGWVFNVNDWPYQGAGSASPKREAFPRYMDMSGPYTRTAHALRVLDGKSGFTLDKLLAAAFDPDMPAFDRLIPALAAAYGATPDGDPLKAKVAAQVDALKAWDRRWSATSTETSLAIFWADALRAKAPAARRGSQAVIENMAAMSPAQQLGALSEASDRLVADFGGWKTPWGEINRFQRLTANIEQTYRDDAPSIPVPFVSSQWGSLASFGAQRRPGTKRYYGDTGNSFVAVVEFGPKVRARAVTAGGESGHPDSPHFDDEAQRYAAGDLREVYFWPEQLRGHVERAYRPGE